MKDLGKLSDDDWCWKKLVKTRTSQLYIAGWIRILYPDMWIVRLIACFSFLVGWERYFMGKPKEQNMSGEVLDLDYSDIGSLWKTHHPFGYDLFKRLARLGGGFKYFLFPSLFGEDSHFDQYFSDGLKPPTRKLWYLRNMCNAVVACSSFTLSNLSNSLQHGTHASEMELWGPYTWPKNQWVTGVSPPPFQWSYGHLLLELVVPGLTLSDRPLEPSKVLVLGPGSFHSCWASLLCTTAMVRSCVSLCMICHSWLKGFFIVTMVNGAWKLLGDERKGDERKGLQPV